MSTQSFKPAHELTFATVLKDSRRLLKLVRDHKTTAILLELGEVRECDSAGLALLIEAKRLCQQFNKQLTLEGMPPSIAALAEFCGVEKMLDHM